MTSLMDAILNGDKDIPFVKQGAKSVFQEFHSPIDGKRIASTEALRAHERQHGVKQVGNDMVNKGCHGLTREQSKLKQQGKI